MELVLGDEHIQEPDLVTGKQNGMRAIRTKNGKEIKGVLSSLTVIDHLLILVCPADFVFIAIGNIPNTQIIGDADPSALAKDRTINVNEYLQVGPAAVCDPLQVLIWFDLNRFNLLSSRARTSSQPVTAPTVPDGEA